MSMLEERKYSCPNCCSNCKNCWKVDVVDLDLSDPRYNPCYCLLGLSEEDKDYLYNEVPDDYIEIGQPFSEHFCELMGMEDYTEIAICPRCMDVTDCCDKYERDERVNY